MVCFPFGAAPTVQQLIEHSQRCQGQDGENKKKKDDETSHIPAIMKWVDFLDLKGDEGQRDSLFSQWEIVWMNSSCDVGHDFWLETIKHKEKKIVNAYDSVWVLVLLQIKFQNESSGC